MRSNTIRCLIAWHARGQRFDPAYLHQNSKRLSIFMLSLFHLCKKYLTFSLTLLRAWLQLGEFDSACFTTSESVLSVMPRRFAFSESIHTCNGFAPFEALQPTQHKAMFSRVAILISLMMCSHERFLLRSELNWQPQYTQLVSRFITAVSIFSGIPQRLLKLNLPIFNLGCKSIQ